MSRRALLALLAIPVFFLAAIPALAKSHMAKRAAAPVVKKVSPMRLSIGHTLTIRGSGFVKGKHKDTVVFMGAGKRVVWVKADRASTRTIKVKLPAKLSVLLADKTGNLKATRLQIRVIARRSGRAFTARRKSPVVVPASTTTGVVTSEPCPGASNPALDSDNDGLSNGLEAALGTNPCSADSDGDGIPDGYEYKAALDFNQNAGAATVPIPYPGKRPYPNALDPSDANVDHDGDGLTMRDEYQASVYLGWTNDVSSVPYSDGDQTTGPVQTDAAYQDVNPDYTRYADMNGDGVIQDDEKDADNDGLPNWDELYGRSTKSWWDAATQRAGETPYPQSFTALNWLDRDTDGDGIIDGADDQDQDGYTNAQEISRPFATWYFSLHNAVGWDAVNSLYDIQRPLIPTGLHAYVNPFNPCLPDPTSAECMKHPPFDNPPSPFNGKPSDAGNNPSDPTNTHQLQWPVQWDA